MSPLWLGLLLISAQQALALTSRCYYGQSCFPTSSQLSTFNSSISGRLVAIRPIRAGCYKGPEYNNTACQEVNKNAMNNVWRSDHIAAYQQINFENCGSETCVPTLSSTCQQGSIPRYGVVAKSSADIVAAVKFATKHNLKIVIKNTGHDVSVFSIRYRDTGNNFSRRSIKDDLPAQIPFFTPAGCSVSGIPAIELGSGVAFDQAYKFADDNGKEIVGGDCGHVGAAGGWLQGGGHGVLASRFGLGVDNTLQWEVVTADGVLRIANACQNSDLFWAMRGGGGGTWGVATRAWVKAHPREELVGITLSSTGLSLIGASIAQPLLKQFASISPALADIGFGGVMIVQQSLGIIVLGAVPKVNGTKLKTITAPLTKPFGGILSGGSILNFGSGSATFTNYSSYWDFYNSTLQTDFEPVGIGARLTSRLIPTAMFKGDANLNTLSKGIIDAATASGPLGTILPIQILIGNPVRNPDTKRETSVTPAWRNSLWHVIITGGWLEGANTNLTRSTIEGINKANAALIKLAPDSGAYQNEANIDEPDHEQTFWGDNLERLQQIKKAVDPKNVFAVWHGVGWEGPKANDFKCYDKYT